MIIFRFGWSSSGSVSSLRSDCSFLLVLSILVNSSHVTRVFVSLDLADFCLPSTYVRWDLMLPPWWFRSCVVLLLSVSVPISIIYCRHHPFAFASTESVFLFFQLVKLCWSKRLLYLPIVIEIWINDSFSLWLSTSRLKFIPLKILIVLLRIAHTIIKYDIINNLLILLRHGHNITTINILLQALQRYKVFLQVSLFLKLL